uniref:NADH dehydrogenase [ubiquinone] 1 alpha subcomplex subunit 3 n=1 Tax=Bos indicus x Bos taurus TaxID=30522 RepID=A0A4W2GQE5_BOBOX
MAERIAASLNNVCAKELVLVASFTSGGVPVILPTLSRNTKYSVMINGPSYPRSSQCPSKTMATCPATLRTPGAQAWSG